MKKITSFLTLCFACTSMVATAQSKFFPHNKRLTPQELKDGREFILGTVSNSDSKNVFDRSSQGTGDFVAMSAITHQSKLVAEPATEGKHYIKCVATGEYLGYNGRNVTWHSTTAEAKVFTIEAVGLTASEGVVAYPKQKNQGGYDIVEGGWGANDGEQLIRLRDGNNIFNCVGYQGKCEFRGGNGGWTVFVPYAPQDITFTAGQTTTTRIAFNGYTVDDTDLPTVAGYLGLLQEGQNLLVNSEASNTNFTYDQFRNPKVPEANKIYYIKGQDSERGYLYHESTQPQHVWATGKSNKSLDRNSDDFKWLVLERDGKKFFYNLGARKFVAPLAQAYGGGNFNGGTWVFTPIPSPISFGDIANKPTYSKLSSNGVALSISPWYSGPVITYYADGDVGVPMTFLELTDDATTAQTAAEGLLNHLNITFHDGGDTYHYATYYANNHTKLPEGADVEVYTITGREGDDRLSLQRHDNKILTAGQGFLLRKQNGDAVTLEVEYEHTAVSAVANNLLVGTVESGVAHEGNYVLNVGSAGIGFYPLRPSATLPPFKATLPHTLFAEGAAPLLINWSILGVDKIATEQPSTQLYYDLSGRRLLERPAKGVYIINGKKVLF